MGTIAPQIGLGYAERLASLHATRLRQTVEKQHVIGVMDYDDWALVLPPPELRTVVKNMGGSGVEIRDCLLNNFTIESNHPSGGFFGPRAVGRNYRRLLEAHPTYVDPMSSLAGAYMTNFLTYRRPHWNPDFNFDFLQAEQKKYRILAGIGGTQHFCQDFSIGLSLGWGGILKKIAAHRLVNTSESSQALYDGLEDVVLGIQNWISRTADAAGELARKEERPELRDDLLETERINRQIVNDPPTSFRGACQWVLWHCLNARMFDGSGSMGRLDKALLPFYEHDREAGILTDEEATFHLACILVRDTGYMQLGGYGHDGKDDTNALSYMFLDAIDQAKLPSNIGVAVGKGIDEGLLHKGVEMILRNRNGIPKFLGFDVTSRDFAKNGYPVQLGWDRVYSGCHWNAIPGREYTLNDIVKINLGVVFDVALQDMKAENPPDMSCATLWKYFEKHLSKAAAVTVKGIEFHLAHMGDVFPELVMDLLCTGPIEKGKDAAAGGLEFYDLCVDAAALATVADSFAALQLRLDQEKKMDWAAMFCFLETNWAGTDGEAARLLMKNGPRFGSGGSIADEWARKVSALFTKLIVDKSVPGKHRFIPGIFSWALVRALGQDLGATPNGRHAGDPISHGANPHPGFRKDGAATAITSAVASVQPGWGNTAPLQLDIDPGTIKGSDGDAIVESLIKTHFALGGTQINLNVLDVKQVLEAYKDPSTHPELVVRVTGFSAYFASLSPEMREFVVGRIISEGKGA